MELRAPFPWFGGKSRAAGLIWPRFGDVANYIEPFAGSLAVLLARPDDYPPRVETVNDKDAYLCNFWRAVQKDPDHVAFYADWPVNETDLHARHRWLAVVVSFDVQPANPNQLRRPLGQHMLLRPRGATTAEDTDRCHVSKAYPIRKETD